MGNVSGRADSEEKDEAMTTTHVCRLRTSSRNWPIVPS